MLVQDLETLQHFLNLLASGCHEQFGAGNEEAAALCFQTKGAAAWGQAMLRRHVRSSG